MARFYYLNFEERTNIEIGLRNGLGFSGISKQIGRPTSTVRREIIKNGGMKGYNAIKAQERHNVREEIKIAHLDEKKELLILREKLEVIEMQLEIVFEMLKEKE